MLIKVHKLNNRAVCNELNFEFRTQTETEVNRINEFNIHKPSSMIKLLKFQMNLTFKVNLNSMKTPSSQTNEEIFFKNRLDLCT